MSVTDEWLVRLILSFGSTVKVESPIILQGRIKREVEKMLKQYDKV
ncbi:hypothetical protein [Vagococcus silagei]